MRIHLAHQRGVTASAYSGIACAHVAASRADRDGLAARDRDAALVELAAERDRSAKLAAAVEIQNRAVEAMGIAKTAADERGKAAQQVAAANGKRLDLAPERAAGAKATTSTEAMTVVDATLEAVR